MSDLSRDLEGYLRTGTQQRVLSPIDIATWGAMLPCVIECYVRGISDEAEELLELLLDRLHPDRWLAPWLRSARTAEIAWAWATLAIARWLKTGELQTPLFAQTIELGYLELGPTWRMDAVDRIVMRMCAGERFADVIALFERPQLAAYRERSPDRAALLGYAFAQHMVTKAFTSDALEDAAERTLTMRPAHWSRGITCKRSRSSSTSRACSSQAARTLVLRSRATSELDADAGHDRAAARGLARAVLARAEPRRRRAGGASRSCRSDRRPRRA